MKTSLQTAMEPLVTACAAALICVLCGIVSVPANADGTGVAAVSGYRVIARFPHDTAHYTQGLEWHGDHFIESSGGYGVSGLFEKKRANGQSLRSIALHPGLFAEGITKFADRLYLLTWRERVALVFDPSYEVVQTYRYEGEGWGLTNDGKQLIMSDGSARLRFRDPDSFAVTHEIEVRDAQTPVTYLNELEYARGLVLANVWQTSRIALIDPQSGRVRNWLDLSALTAEIPNWNSTDNVLNGIAYDGETGHLYVTGKRWPLLFELSIDWPDDAQK